MAGPRGAIKVGSGYISIEPHLDRAALRRMQTQLGQAMGKAGREAGKALGTGMSRGFTGLSSQATAEARKMQQGMTRESAKGSRERQKVKETEAQRYTRVEQELTRTHGSQVATRARQALEASEDRTRGLSREAKTALRLHQQSLEGMARADQELARTQDRTTRRRAQALLVAYRQDLEAYRRTEAEKARTADEGATAQGQAARRTAAEKRRALEDSARMDREIHQQQIRQDRERDTYMRAYYAAHRENERRKRAEVLETARLERQALTQMAAARRADLREQLATAAVQRRMLQDQIAVNRTALAGMAATSGSFFKRFNSGWSTASGKVEGFGTRTVETGRLITHHLIGPVGLLSAGLTAVGVKSADSMMQAQTGLRGMGLEIKDVTGMLKEMQKYAIATPYSLQDMQKYGTRYARAIGAHDRDFRSDDPDRKKIGSERVAKKSGDVVKMIGDSAAFGGIMDPTLVGQGMYAMEVIMDMGRIPMRNLKQFERAVGMPAQDLALMMGFKDGKDKHGNRQDASAKMYEFMQNAKETGGLQGTKFVDALLERWEKGNNGIQGSAARMAGATISGRIGQMRESGQVALQKLFMKEGKGGQFEYTGLGETIMGKKTARRDKSGKVIKDENGEVQYDYQGGMLNDAKSLGKKLIPMAGELLEDFFSVLKTFTGWIKSTVDFLSKHPGLRDAILTAAKVAAVAAPFLITFGLLTKMVGKLAKLMSPVLGVFRGIVAGGSGLTRVSKQLAAGVKGAGGPRGFWGSWKDRRTELRGGDSRNLAQRGWDRARGQDSRAEDVRVNTGQAEQSLRALDEKIRALKQELRGVNTISIDPAMNALGGTAGRSLAAAAQDARQKIQQAVSAMSELNGRTTGGVRQEVGFLAQKAETAESKIKGAISAVEGLNGRPLAALRQEFDWSTPKAKEFRRAVQEAIDRMTTLNQKPVKTLRNNLRGGGNSLYSAVDDVAGKLSTANSRFDSLAKKRVSGTTASVNNLKNALKGAADEGAKLNTHVGHVNEITGGNGGKGGKGGGRTKKALGGVLPGYAPGVDSIPAILSPGEAILRPEVAARLGTGTIDHWNAAAARGHLSRFAKGGIAGKKGGGGKRWPMSILDELHSAIDFAPSFNTFTSGIGMAAAGNRIGGELGGNVRRWGAEAGGDASGRAANNRFGNLRTFMFERLPDFLKATPTGVGQLVGLAAGAVAPTAGDLFWSDVWKGKGNILERGMKFTDDLLSPSKLFEMIKDLVGGVGELVKNLGSLAKDLISDPTKVLDEAITTLKELFSGVVDDVKSMTDLIGQLVSNPSEFAAEVWQHFYARAEEMMPNREGLFKFAGGGIVPGYAPGNDRVHALLSPGEAVLRPDAVRALGYRAVLGLNRAAKTGTPATAPAQPAPVPDAAAFEDAAKRIQAALTAMTAAVHSHQSASSAAWADVAGQVQGAVDGQIRPAQQRWVSHLSGPLSGAVSGFRDSTRAHWVAVQSQVASSTSSTLDSFARLRSGLDSTKRFFETSSSRITDVWRSAMSYVDSSTRSTVSGPYNAGAVSMMGAMAKLAGAPAPLSPVHYATGGIVPGYQPGVDTVPAMLSRGEGILRPEVVRTLGRETILRWNEQARRGGHIYARGGIVGDGAAWVKQHQDDPLDGYEEAVRQGWDAAITPHLKSLGSKFGTVGRLSADGFGKAEPWLAKWGQWADEHATGGGGQVVKLALQEAKSGDLSGQKYIGSSAYESWCADFVSWIVDHAHANAAYGNSPTGTPGNRWPAVATWVERMSMVPTSAARPGDLMVFKGYGPGAWGHIDIATGKQGSTLETVGGNESRSIRRQLGYGNRADGALRPKGGAPGASEGPVLNPWPGSLVKFTEGSGEFAGLTGDAVNRWRPLVERVIQELGGKGGISLSDAGLVLQRIGVESGGDPNAVNNWDSNAKSGDPSKGLMQVIKSTFDAYAGPYRSLGQYSPIASIYAGLNYAIDRYGSGWRRALGGTNGYWTGTKSATAGLAMVGEHGPELVNFQGGERVYNARQTQDMVAGRRYEIHIHEAKSENTEQAVLRAMRTAEVMAGF
ncbi:putative ORF9 [Streptomyces albireticuli]|uniref:Putative ORF9 n=1 Tax=Streptomyces albireticuli TaxID=1940 RepID=A0A1Z2KXY2_9ACTN|nr:CHAP domain-containing protein [Streptomyces albireticuli]ARZ66915.1 putative ORF9 [Streptomyces albireticuli]